MVYSLQGHRPDERPHGLLTSRVGRRQKTGNGTEMPTERNNQERKSYACEKTERKRKSQIVSVNGFGIGQK